MNKDYYSNATKSLKSEKIANEAKLRERLGQLRRRCDSCPARFTCYTVNTAQRPEIVTGINFEVAKCCYKCVHSYFRIAITYADHSKFGGIRSGYKIVGKCKLHQVIVHQLSVCKDFATKSANNALTCAVYREIEREMKTVKRNYGLPRYCLMDKKHIP
ncbi:unnamed protein product [marine sediment metagenome]|uniref:Uncharacterized protein n=1 Tax=marine sediment metagenome TaxID=412755 RepID=X0WVI2_9ZZZZ